METFATRAGALALDESSVELQEAIEVAKSIMCGFAIEPWLSRFPGFVDGLEHRLHTYAAALCIAEADYSADQLDGEPSDPRGPFWALLWCLWLLRIGGEVTEEDYEW